MAGSEAHAAWLDEQLRRATPGASSEASDSVAQPSSEAVSAQPTSTPVWERSVALDTSAGSARHSSWLERQLRPLTQSASAPPRVEATAPVMQPDHSLPSGAQALLRGQDLSALSHAEWLDAQLGVQRGAAQPARVPVMNPAAPPIAPPTMRHAEADVALGSTRHGAWLDQQLALQARRGPAQLGR